MHLLQDRLDVKNKTRSNIFNWRGQFTPQFVDYILENFTSCGDSVIDPFSGSGTVLLESARRDIACHGNEVNPAAYAMSAFFTFCNIPPLERNEISSIFQEKMGRLLTRFDKLQLFSQEIQFREKYRDLLDFSQELFFRMEHTSERILAINTLFIAENYKNCDLTTSFCKAANYVSNCLINLPYTDKPITANLGDARRLHENNPFKAKVILTSPPYINVFNYHQNHRAILEAIGWNMLEVAQSEIGSNRKNRGNRYRTVAQYCVDMELSLKSFWQCLTNDGVIVIIVGKKSNVLRTPFYNGEITKEIAQGSGAYQNEHNFQRTFINRFGMDIKEDIIVLSKTSMYPSISVAKEVANRHLQSALKFAPEDEKGNIQNIVDNIDAIKPSPLLSVRRNYLDVKNAA
jgi:DNA modification methylase